MNHSVLNLVGWLALVILIAVATLAWGIAGFLVWVSGNGTLTGAVWSSEN
jgi:hypothetical protein